MMKQITYKKRAAIHGLSMAVFLGACLGAQAIDNEKAVSADASVNTDRSAAISTDRSIDRSTTVSTDRKYDNNGKLSHGDTSFIKEAAKGGLMEVEMSQMAKDHATNPEVKSYGEMLVKDHSKANEKLSQLAASKGVNLAKDGPDPKGDKMMNDIKGKQGADFDRNFIEHAVRDHKKDIAKFEKASRDLSDTELRSFATDTLPTLRSHLEEAQRLAKSMGVNISANDASEINHDQNYADQRNAAAVGSAASSVGSPGLSTSERNSSVNRIETDRDHNVDVNVDTKGSNKGIEVNTDSSKSATPRADANVDVNTSKNDGKTLGIDTRAGDNKTLGVETQKGDDKVLGVKTRPGDGKTLGLNTRKDDGKFLGFIPDPWAKRRVENRVDVDMNAGSAGVSANTSADKDASIGAPASSEKGASASATATTDHDSKHSSSADSRTLSYSDLPQAVQDTVKAQGATSSDVKNVRKHTKNGKTEYVVKTNNRTLHVAEDGTIIKDNK